MKQRKLAMCFKNSNYTLGSPLPEDCEMDELALNSFKITEENYPLSLDLVKLPNGINLIIELNFYKTMNVSTLKPQTMRIAQRTRSCWRPGLRMYRTTQYC
jgi:hypothetical protein